jgi:hypothetical protein
MSGAFLNNPQEPLTAMAIHTTREAAEAYANEFVEHGLIRTWYIREWANMFHLGIQELLPIPVS